MHVIKVTAGKISKFHYLKEPVELYMNDILSCYDPDVAGHIKSVIYQMLSEKEKTKTIEVDGIIYHVEIRTKNGKLLDFKNIKLPIEIEKDVRDNNLTSLIKNQRFFSS